MLVVSSGFLKYMAEFQPNKLDFVLSFPKTLLRYLHMFHLNWEQLLQLNYLFCWVFFFTGLVFSLAQCQVYLRAEYDYTYLSISETSQ